MIDVYKDLQDVLSVAGYTQNGLESIDHRGEESRPLQQGRAYLCNATNHQVTIPADTFFDRGNGDYTISLWHKPNTNAGNGGIFSGTRGVGVPSIRPYFIYRVGGSYFFYSASNGGVASWDISGGGQSIGAFNLNQWNHILVTRSAGVHRLVLNNVQNTSFTNNTAVFYNAASVLSMNEYTDFSGGEYCEVGFWNRSMNVQEQSDIFTRRVYNFNGCGLFLKCDESGGTLAVNSGSLNNLTDGTLLNGITHTLQTDGGGCNFQNQFGCTPSMRFNGGTITSGVNLGTTANPQFLQHTAFTVHFWVVQNSGSNNFLSNLNAGSTAGQFQFATNTTNLTLYDSFSNSYLISDVNIIPLNTDTHIALVRENTAANGVKWYVNGNFRGRLTWAQTNTAITQLIIGGEPSGNPASVSLDGWMRNFCIVPSAIWTESGATVGNNIFTPPTTWANYQALELTNPSKLAIYNTNITNNPLNVPLTLTNTTNCLIPRNESNINFDAFGSPLFFKGRAKYNLALIRSNALTFDNTNDFVLLPNPPAIGTSDYRLEISFIVSAIGGNRNLVYIGDNANFIRIRIRQASGSINIDHAGFNTNNIYDVVLNTFYTLVLTKTGSNATVTLNGVLIYTNTGSFTGSVASSVHALGTNFGLNNDTFGNTMLNYKLRVAGVDFCNFPMQEGAGDRIFSKINGHVGTLNNFAFPTAWATKQDVIHSNLLHGFDECIKTIAIGTDQSVFVATTTTWTANHTIDFWIYNLDNPTGLRGYLDQTNATLNDYFQIWDNNTNMRINLRVGAVEQYNFLVARTIFTQNAWTHCAVVRNGTTATVYINGLSVASQVCNTATFTPTANFGIGSLRPINTGLNSNAYYANVRHTNTAKWTANFNTALPTLESDYADLTNVVFLVRGSRDITGKAITLFGTPSFVKRPITATNPQTQSNPAGTWHNNSEVVVRQPLVPALIRLDILNTFYTAGIANLLTFANLPNNVSNLGNITCKTSVAQRRSNLKVYRGFN